MRNEALSLYVAGLSVREIARRLGTSKSTISRIVSGTSHHGNKQPEQPAQPAPTPPAPSTHIQYSSSTDIIVANASAAIADLIKQIHNVTFGETDVAKLATAADKISAIVERINNVERINSQENNASSFLADFAARHTQSGKKS